MLEHPTLHDRLGGMPGLEWLVNPFYLKVLKWM